MQLDGDVNASIDILKKLPPDRREVTLGETVQDLRMRQLSRSREHTLQSRGRPYLQVGEEVTKCDIGRMPTYPSKTFIIPSGDILPDGGAMEECELCGENIDSVYGINVEGVELRVCSSCAKGKRIVYREDKRSMKREIAKKQAKPRREEVEIVDNYGLKIRKARESMKLPLKVLAELINEKESLLARVESEGTLPSEVLTRKLEKALSIKLEQQVVEQERAQRRDKKENATLGEFVG